MARTYSHLNIVQRADGERINAGRKRGMLLVCASGCCCGLTDHGFAPVPTELYHNEWVRRKLRNVVHLSLGGCLGPCQLANVVLLLFDGVPIWFHSVNSEAAIRQIYDYIDMLRHAEAVVPPPEPLQSLVFNGFAWGDLDASAQYITTHHPQEGMGRRTNVEVIALDE